MLYDLQVRKTIAEDHAALLRRDFLAPRRHLRAALGRRLVRLGAWLAGEPAVAELRRGYESSRLRSSACQ